MMTRRPLWMRKVQGEALLRRKELPPSDSELSIRRLVSPMLFVTQAIQFSAPGSMLGRLPKDSYTYTKESARQGML